MTAGSATAKARPGKPAPAPMSATRPSRGNAGRSSAAEAVGEVDPRGVLGPADGGRGIRLGGQGLQEAGELVDLVIGEVPVHPGERERFT